MEFIADRDEFIRTLQRVQGVVEKRNTMPILSNVYMEATSSGVQIAATDLEIFIKDAFAANIKKKGAITINARKLFEIIKQLPEKDVSITAQEGEKLTIKSGRSRFNIMGISAKEFPSFPSSEEADISKIDPEALKEIIDKTSFAVSTDETRYNINGFYFEKTENDSLRVVTTDGHRLSMIEKASLNIPLEKNGAILPRKGMTEIRRLLEEEGSFSFGVAKKSATMKKDSTTINIRRIEGEFPDYKQVVPKDNDKTVVIGRIELLESLKRVSVLSSDKTRGVKFAFSKGKLTLSSSSPDIGDATEEVSVDYGAEDLEIAFNARYFIDALEVLSEDKVAIKLKDQLNPAILNPYDNAEYSYIIMPMRL